MFNLAQLQNPTGIVTNGYAQGADTIPLVALQGLMTKDPKKWTPQDSLALHAVRPEIEIAQQFGLVGNNFLRRYEWEEIDAAVRDVIRTQLMVVQDLLDAGLRKPLGGLGTIFSTYEELTDMGAASIDMSAESDSGNDGVGYTPVMIPVPIVHKGFRLDARTLAASRNGGGEPIDTTQVRVATRKVAEAMEGLVLNGTGAPTVNGNVIQGFTNKTNRQADTATNFGGGDFGTENNGYKTINGMIQALRTIGFYGPYGCYVSPTQGGQLRNRQTDGSGQNELRSILENLGPVGLRYIKDCPTLADGNVVVFQLTQEVVDVAVALDPTVIMWDSKGGLISEYKVLAAITPRIKGSTANSVGVAHATGA